MAKVSNNKKCTWCGVEKSPKDSFYLSRSSLYKENDERLPVCKECLLKRYQEYLDFYKDEYKAMYHLCMNFDIYFSKNLLESSLNNTNKNDGVLGAYMKNVNMFQYRNMTSLNSDHIVLNEVILNELEEKFKVEQVKKNKKKDKSKITDEIRKKWWGEYTDEECVLLERYYDYYYENYDHEKDLAKLDGIKEVCTFKLIIAQAKKEKDNRTIKEFSTLISQKLADSNLKPSQRKAYGDQAGEGLGTDIRVLIENNMPVAEVLPQFKDVDKFSSMIERTFLEPFKRINGLSSNVKHGDHNDN